jgi:hypothetical protein
LVIAQVSITLALKLIRKYFVGPERPLSDKNGTLVREDRWSREFMSQSSLTRVVESETAGAPAESAELLQRLGELRREPTMRTAREWFVRRFAPRSAKDVHEGLRGPWSAHFRLVTSYWDMAASLVLIGAIDGQMFHDADGEHLVVFAKLAPFLTEYRTQMGPVVNLSSLEQLVHRQPETVARLASIRASLGT